MEKEIGETDAYGLFQKGLRLLGDGHPHQAAVVLERASLLEPAKASIREALARALFNSGRIERSCQEFERVLEIDPSNDYARFGLGLARARLGDREAALGQLKMAVAMRPEAKPYREALDRLAR